MCKACKGFWKGGMGASRFVQFTGAPRPACLLAAHFRRAPGEALNQLVKSRLDFYKRFEPTAAARDVALLVDPALTNRFLFS